MIGQPYNQTYTRCEKMQGPSRLFLEITTECNLRCKLCTLWQNTDYPTKLSTLDKVHLLTRLASWLQSQRGIDPKSFPVIFTGGEPFRQADQVWTLASTCTALGFPCYINTNGTLLRPYLARIPACGLSAITISLDSHLARIHDDLRGIPGTYARALASLQVLIAERNRQHSRLKIYVQSILGKWNIDFLETHVQWAAGLGVDGVTFQCIQYPFGLPIPREWHVDFPYYPTLPQVHDEIQTALRLKAQGFPIANAPEEIWWWDTYFQNPETLPYGFGPCCAADQNLIIDIYGNVKFCFNKVLEPATRVGAVSQNLEDLWSGAAALQVKQEMRGCHRSCGVMVCHCDSKIRDPQITEECRKC